MPVEHVTTDLSGVGSQPSAGISVQSPVIQDLVHAQSLLKPVKTRQQVCEALLKAVKRTKQIYESFQK